METQLGGGALMQRKPPALRHIGSDRNVRSLRAFRCAYAVELVHGCCHRFLAQFPFAGDELVYADPPYLLAARKSQRRYRYDYTQAEHEQLLELLTGLPCAVMLSADAVTRASQQRRHRRRDHCRHWLALPLCAAAARPQARSPDPSDIPLHRDLEQCAELLAVAPVGGPAVRTIAALRLRLEPLLPHRQTGPLGPRMRDGSALPPRGRRGSASAPGRAGAAAVPASLPP
jgi:hypothetical protein